MKTIYAWKGDEQSTHMRLRNRGEPKGFSRLIAPFMSRAMGKAIQDDLSRLKKLLESR